MADRSPGPYMARRRLGSGLRTVREQANIRIEAAARELECSPAKISRIENGQGPAKLWDVRILLQLYGVDDPAVRRRFEGWAQGTKSESWWESDADLTSDDIDRYFAAETEAARIRMYCTPVLPVLLQTRDYAVAHIRALHPDWSEADVQRFADVRMERQAPLRRPDDPLIFESVIDQAAVLRRVGSAEVHEAQLTWLADLLDTFHEAGRTNLTVRIVPLSQGPGRALGPLTIFEPRNRDIDPLSAFFEEFADTGSWIEAGAVPDVVSIYEERLRAAADAATSPHILRAAAAATARISAPTFGSSSTPTER